MLFPIVVQEGGSLDGLADFPERHRIENRYMFPLLNQPVYRRLFGEIKKPYPAGQWINLCSFYVGGYHELVPEDVADAADVFDANFSRGPGAEMAGGGEDPRDGWGGRGSIGAGGGRQG